MAETTIDKLSVEIDYSANQAGNGLNNLKDAIADVQAILPDSISKFKSFNTAVGNLTKNLTGFASINTTQVGKGFENITESMKSFESLGKTNLGSLLNQLKKIPEINRQLDSKVIDEFAQKINKLNVSLIPLANNLSKVGNVLSNMPSKLNKVGNYTAKTQKNFSLLQTISSALNFSALVYGAKKVGETLGGFVKSSNDYVESLNLFTVSMGENTQQAKEWINTVTEALGLDPSEMMKYMGVFNIMASGFGIASDKAYLMSKNLTQLTYDISSFYNLDIEESANKVKSALAGELEPVEVEGGYVYITLFQQIAA